MSPDKYVYQPGAFYQDSARNNHHQYDTGDENFFIDVENDRFKINGYVSFFAQRPLDISWEWGELGHFTIDTHSEPIGDEFSLRLYWDPSGQSNYKYGFNVTAPEFLETYFQVSWYKNEDLLIPYIWIVGDLPINWDSWEKTLLWNYEWWQVA